MRHCPTTEHTMNHPTAPIYLHLVGGSPAVRYAGETLAVTLRQMLPQSPVELKSTPPGFADSGQAIVIGEASDIGSLADASLVTAGRGDDAIAIRVTSRRGVIAGSNPRAVLFAVYRYLEALGCRWLRPGAGGSRIPTLTTLPEGTIEIKHTPSCRHRCICIEGSTSVEHALDLVDYATRRGFNSYFIQFRNAFTFFNRWYGEESRREEPRSRLSSEAAMVYRDQLKAAILQRGLDLHAVGHGWTCEPFGIKGEEWHPSADPVPEEARPFLALVNGKRDLHEGIALNTNLDLSNPEARSIMAQAVSDYALEHADESPLHVWLADGFNNQDESARARAKLPSDWYVLLLNEIDARLSEAGLKTRIVFLAYFDLLWAPREERLLNPDRFILMFAPITRSYTRSFLEAALDTDDTPVSIPPFRLNQNTFPEDPAVNLRMLEGWREVFQGEVIDFDYHLWWNLQGDPTHLPTARVLCEDCRDMKALGMDGLISCQIQRVAFPTGIAMHVMGEALWDRTRLFEDLAEAYFRDLFGEAGDQVRAYLERIDSCLDAKSLREEPPEDGIRHDAIAGLDRIPQVVESFASTIATGRENPDPITTTAFDLLREHAEFLVGFARIHRLRLARDPAAVDAYHQLARQLAQRLPKLHPVWDTWITLDRLRDSLVRAGMIKPDGATIGPE